MSKEEWFEHIENKIRRAVKNNPPAFNVKAWVKMEALLDKEEKKLKTFFWCFFLALLLVSGTYIFYNHNNKPVVTAENILNTTDTGYNTNRAGDLTLTTLQTTIPGNIFPIDGMKENESSSPDKIALPAQKTIINKRKANINIQDAEMEDNKNTSERNLKVTVRKAGKRKVVVTESAPIDTIDGLDEKKNDLAGTTDAKPNAKAALTKTIKDNQDSRPGSNSNSQKTVADVTTPAKKNEFVNTQKKSSRHYFLASLGPNIGSVKLFSFKNSAAAAKYGVGAGYQLTKKLSLQTGFYAGRQIYLAGANDYHTKIPPSDTLTFVSADADCLIYEIPLTIRYDILKKSALSYYTSIGLSSYIMKKEHYDICLVSDSGYDVQRYRNFTGNQHLFANLTLSAGIEKKISPSLSLQLEPSISIPLTGVGRGKVKLFSSTIMLGIKYSPLRK